MTLSTASPARSYLSRIDARHWRGTLSVGPAAAEHDDQCQRRADRQRGRWSDADAEIQGRRKEDHRSRQCADSSGITSPAISTGICEENRNGGARKLDVSKLPSEASAFFSNKSGVRYPSPFMEARGVGMAGEGGIRTHSAREASAFFSLLALSKDKCEERE